MAPYITPKSAFSTDATTLDDTSFDANNVQDHSLLSVDSATTEQSSKELLSLAEIAPIFTKSHNRHNFAALLVKHLFDVPTRMRSNVAGHGKEKLDPEIKNTSRRKSSNIMSVTHLKLKKNEQDV